MLHTMQQHVIILAILRLHNFKFIMSFYSATTAIFFGLPILIKQSELILCPITKQNTIRQFDF